MISLTITKILEFYDVPQLFVATDAIGTDYLCVLFSHGDCYEYLGVQVSEKRLIWFLEGNLDLFRAYTSPERDNSLYHVSVRGNTVAADRLLQPADVTSEMLPEPGFYYDSGDTPCDSGVESLQVDIPVKDRGFFADMVVRMGWASKAVDKAARRIAVF